MEFHGMKLGLRMIQQFSRNAREFFGRSLSCKTSFSVSRRESIERRESSSACFRVRIKLMPLLIENHECSSSSSSADFYRLGNESIIIFASLQSLTFLVDVLHRIRRRLRNKYGSTFAFSDFARSNCERASEDKSRCYRAGRRCRGRSFFVESIKNKDWSCYSR